MTSRAQLPELLASARVRLDDARVPLERHARVVTPKRILGIPRQARLELDVPVWPLGQLLLGEDGSLFAAGYTVTPREDRPIGYTSERQRARDKLRTMASRAGIPLGSAVHIDPQLLWGSGEVSGTVAGPLIEDGEALAVRWSTMPGAAVRPLAEYLEEHIELLIQQRGPKR